MRAFLINSIDDFYRHLSKIVIELVANDWHNKKQYPNG